VVCLALCFEFKTMYAISIICKCPLISSVDILRFEFSLVDGLIQATPYFNLIILSFATPSYFTNPGLRYIIINNSMQATKTLTLTKEQETA